MLFSSLLGEAHSAGFEGPICGEREGRGKGWRTGREEKGREKNTQ